MEKAILQLGNPRLYEVSSPVERMELSQVSSIIQDLHDTLLAFRKQFHVGRAIAAPQIGIQKRILYMNIDKEVVFINPVLSFSDEAMMAVLDDCMSFPNLLVKVMRYKRCRIDYLDLEWKECSMELAGDLSELLQHEYDHLDGILATMRAINNQAFVIKK